jgi:hypothetical protein
MMASMDMGMVGATGLASQGNGARPQQQGNQQQSRCTVGPTDAECGMDQEAEENDRRLIHAKICLFGIRHHSCAVERLAHLSSNDVWEESLGTSSADAVDEEIVVKVLKAPR